MVFNISILIIVGLLFISLTGILLLATLYISYRRKQFRRRNRSIKELIDIAISEHMLIALEEDTAANVFTTSDNIRILMKRRFNRNVMIAELVTARKSFSGRAGNAIQELYEQLRLHEHSAKKLLSNKWHIRARAIQELSIMQQKQYWKQIYKLTNNKNDHLRMEAQAGIIRLLGFRGLRFLNVTTHAITEWQMINLLQLLKNIPPNDFQGIERWLRSNNPCVLIFALKLVARFRRYELHEQVCNCIKHTDPQIRAQASKTITILGLEQNMEITE